MPVLTMLNQKGGVGKSSCTHHLAGTLSTRPGSRILLVDADPQSSLTQGFWGPIATRELPPAETIAALFAGDEPYPEQVIRPTGIPRIDLVPGSKASTRYNIPLPGESSTAVQACLREFLAEVRDRYDLVMIDCPPNLHMCSWAALVASDFLIVPLQPEDYGAQGIIDVQESVNMVLSGPNPGLKLLGYLITMFNSRMSIHKAYEGMLREMYGPLVFSAMVPLAADYKEAIAQRKPVAQYKPKGAPAKAIQALAAELLSRLADTPRITSQEAA